MTPSSFAPPPWPPSASPPAPTTGSRSADILFSDAHAVSRLNRDGRFVVDLSNYAEVRSAFDKILKVLEQADTEP